MLWQQDLITCRQELNKRHIYLCDIKEGRLNGKFYFTMILLQHDFYENTNIKIMFYRSENAAHKIGQGNNQLCSKEEFV